MTKSTSVRNLGYGWCVVGVVVAVMAMGCGSDDTTQQGGVSGSLPQPMIQMVAPTLIKAGDHLSILGQGFVDAKVGQTQVRFQGVYQTTAGQSEQVNLEIRPTFDNQGTLSWTFGPNIPFSTQQQTGVFRGMIQVVNVGLGGQRSQIHSKSVQLEVGPSIIIRQMRPLDAGCSGLTATTDNTRFLLEVEAVGLRAGTETSPIRYGYSFLKDHFQFEGYLGSTLGVDPDALFPVKSGSYTVVDVVHDGAISSLGNGVPNSLQVHQGVVNTLDLTGVTGSLDSLFQLTHLKTAAIDTEKNPNQNGYDATIAISAVDSTGLVAKRNISLRVWSPVEVNYGGHATVVRSFDPVPVSGCISGGQISREVTYAEQTTEQRQRAFTIDGERRGEGASGVDLKVFGTGVNVATKLAAAFGFEVTSVVTSQQSKDLQIKGVVLPNEFGVFYRQTLQMERVGQLRLHGVCGSTQDVGKVTVTDWVWSPDLAKGRRCPPLPASNLDKGRVFKPGS